jgi:hypothetical protein
MSQHVVTGSHWQDWTGIPTIGGAGVAVTSAYWVNPTDNDQSAANTFKMAGTGGNGIECIHYYDATNAIRYKRWNTTHTDHLDVNFGITMNFGSWNSIMIIDPGDGVGANIKCYLNGSLLTTSVLQGLTTGSYDSGTGCGVDSQCTGQYVARVAFWNAALTGGDATSFNAGVAPSAIGAVAWWRELLNDSTTGGGSGGGASSGTANFDAIHPTSSSGSVAVAGRRLLLGVGA